MSKRIRRIPGKPSRTRIALYLNMGMKIVLTMILLALVVLQTGNLEAEQQDKTKRQAGGETEWNYTERQTQAEGQSRTGSSNAEELKYTEGQSYNGQSNAEEQTYTVGQSHSDGRNYTDGWDYTEGQNSAEGQNLTAEQSFTAGHNQTAGVYLKEGQNQTESQDYAGETNMGRQNTSRCTLPQQTDETVSRANHAFNRFCRLREEIEDPENYTQDGGENASPFASPELVHLAFREKVVALDFLVCNRTCYKPRDSVHKVFCAACFCDAACEDFDDCCPGFQPPALLPDHRPFCRVLSLSPKIREEISIVSECPAHFNDSCRPGGVSKLQPLYDHVMKLTFMNEQCAQCNGFPSRGLDGWKFAHRCYGKKIDPLSLESRGLCNAFFLSPPMTFTPRVCLRSEEELISTCNVTGKWPAFDPLVQRACHSYRHRVDVFQNVFCLLCNLDMDWNNLIHVSSLSIFYLFPSVTAINGGDFKSGLSVLFDTLPVTGATDPSANELLPDTCGKDEIFLAEKATCEIVFCADGLVPEFGKCLPTSQAAMAADYQTCLSLEIPTEEAMARSDEIFLKVQGQQQLLRENLDGHGDRISHICLSGTSFSRTLLMAMVFPDVALSDVIDVSTYVGAGLTVKGVGDWGSPSTPTVLPSCPEERQWLCLGRKEGLYEVLPSNDTRVQRVSHGSFRPGKEVTYLSKLAACAQIVLTPDEYQLDADSNTLRVHLTDAILGPLEYSLNPETHLAMVCVWQTLSDSAGRSKGYTTLWLVSLISVAASSVCLIIIIAAYASFRTLRTRTGIVNLIVSIVLLAALLLYQFGLGLVELPLLCVALGMLMHHLWLASVVGLNASCILMYYRLARPMFAFLHLSSQSRTLVAVCAYIFLLPALIVGCTAGANWALYGHLGYGGEVCYIRGRLSRQLSFLLPVGLLVAANIVLFLKAAHAATAGSTPATTHSSRATLQVYVKLSTVSGFCWGLGLLAELTDLEALHYLFAIFTGSQGVFLFGAFLCNRRTLQEMGFLTRTLSQSTQQQGRQPQNTMPTN